MIVLALIGILAAIALPIYTEHVRKGRRSDAVTALSAIQQAQERWRANSPSYADQLATLGFNSSYSPKGYYALSLSDVGPSGYVVTASVVSSAVQAADSKCASMWVKLERGNISYLSSSPGCWPE